MEKALCCSGLGEREKSKKEMEGRRERRERSELIVKRGVKRRWGKEKGETKSPR